MNDRSTLLLEHHLKELKLPSFLREYEKMAVQCASEGVDHPQYLLRLAELELIDRHPLLAAKASKPSPLGEGGGPGSASARTSVRASGPRGGMSTVQRVQRGHSFRMGAGRRSQPRTVP